ncbi:MAG: methionine gamma-lyase [Peptococcaceae bacterium]|jgi:methionine-gamma-lyase|nr:methionine gamma-lyase [Peptococcaceae bacterium]
MKTAATGFGTQAIHGGERHQNPCGALNVPIYQNATFVFDNCHQGGKRFAGEEKGYIYSRLGNPSVAALEERVALLEQTEAAVAFSSGMGAITAVIWSIAAAGAHIVADITLYGCTFAFLEHGITRYGVEVTFVDLSDPANLQRALRENTALVYMETPANPNLKVIDIPAIAATAHKYNPKIMIVCDNTFATPYLQRPAPLGCDVVVHSATKYLNGHGDVIAGLACGKAEFMQTVRFFGLKDMTGAVLGPFEAFLILRGIKTLEVRMERHCDNAEKIVEYLLRQPKVERVYYPGLAEHPNHAAAQKQMRRFGGMLAFEVKGGRAAGEKLLDNLSLCVLAVSLGDAETLVEHPASMTHSTYTPEELEASCVPAGLVRLSAGLENPEDIIADLEQGFAKI